MINLDRRCDKFYWQQWPIKWMTDKVDFWFGTGVEECRGSGMLAPAVFPGARIFPANPQ
jgi:hypothetical protein